MRMKGKRWMQKEDNFLREYANKEPHQVIAKKLERTTESVRARISKLGISRINYWTNDEDKYLDQNYEHSTWEELMTRINRSEGAIRHRASILGLSRFTDDEYAVYRGDDLLIVGTRDEIAARMNFKLKTVIEYISHAKRNERETGTNVFCGLTFVDLDSDES